MRRSSPEWDRTEGRGGILELRGDESRPPPHSTMTHSLNLARAAVLYDNAMHVRRSGMTTMANHLVQARIDRAVKEKAATVLAAMGLTVSDAVRLLLTRVAREKALPFAPLVPNDETIAAMKEARSGNLPQFADVSSLFDDLHADD